MYLQRVQATQLGYAFSQRLSRSDVIQIQNMMYTVLMMRPAREQPAEHQQPVTGVSNKILIC